MLLAINSSGTTPQDVQGDRLPVLSSSDRRVNFRTLTIIMASALLLISCEKEVTGIRDVDYNAPLVDAARLNYDFFNLDTSVNPAITRLPDSLFRISPTLTASIRTNDDPATIGRVEFRLYPPVGGTPVQEGLMSLTPPAGGTGILTYTAGFSLTLKKNGRGLYTVDVRARTATGRESNVMRIPLTVCVNNVPPSLGSPALRLFTPPASDSTQFTLTIAAYDDDGLQGIRSVTVRALASTDTMPRPLLDDGSVGNGDAFPGDGIFSTVIWVKPAGALANVRFEFVATDRELAAGPPVVRTLDNNPPAILELTVPDSIRRPASGSRSVFFYLAAEDPDGLFDIDSVYFRNLSSTNPTDILMYDDGNLAAHGDAVADDGIFSRGLTIDATTSLGTKEFVFTVVDKFGARSSRTRFITIHN